MADLFWFLLIAAAMAFVSWTSWRAGADSAQREAEYTIANLRRSNRVLRSELDVQAMHKRLRS